MQPQGHPRRRRRSNLGSFEANSALDAPLQRAEERERALLALLQADPSDRRAAIESVTEALAVLVRAERTSVWRFTPERDAIVCENTFLLEELRHLSGQTIRAADCPRYLAALERTLVLRVDDALNHSDTEELHAEYLVPLGIGAMMDVPIWNSGRLWGVLCCEHVGGPRTWTRHDEETACKLASHIALSLQASERAAAEARWQVVIDAIPELVAEIDADGRWIKANAAAKRALAEETDMVVGGRFTGLELKDLAGRVLDASEWPGERARHGASVRSELIEMRSLRTERRRWFRVSAAPVIVGGAIASAVVTCADVTDEVHLEHLKRDLLAALAHELRTPTTIVKGHAQHLLRGEGLAADVASAVSTVERAADRLARLTGDLVDVSAITLGRIILSCELFDLGALLASHLARASESKDGHRFISGVIASAPALVYADRLRTDQVIARLIDNAKRFSPPDSPIEVALAVKPDHVLVSVRDEGIGIPSDKQPHVFEAFFRAHVGTPYDVGGLGIGLFLAREVLARHGGAIWFESVEGRGSTFTLRLPLARAAP